MLLLFSIPLPQRRNGMSWVHFQRVFALAMLVSACGEPVSDPQNNSDLEIVGAWVTPWGVENITDENWNNAEIVSFDNASNTVITKMAADADAPETFSKLIWTELNGERFHYCTVAYGLDSLDAAENAEDISDPNDLDGAGCGGFPWTLMRLPLSIKGTYVSEFGAETITEMEWDNGFTKNQIKDWNEDDQWVIVQVPPTAEYNPNTFSTIFWINYIEGESRGVYYCTHAFALETLGEAQAVDSQPDSSNPEEGGCSDFPWTKLALQ